MDLGLANKVVLVTGASKGIGRATAILFGQEKAKVALTYLSDRQGAEGTAEAVKEAGGEPYLLPFDLSSEESIKTAVRSIVERWGPIDGLVNNAVRWGPRPPWGKHLFEELPPDEWRPFVHTNLDGAYMTMQAVVPSMRSKGWGRIVNISSGIAMDGLPGAGPYASAKAALHGLTRTLTRELGPAGILVNVVMPGLTLTERNAANIPKEMQEQVAKSSPIQRLLTAQEVAPMIVFLCSAANTGVTGEIIRVSGGIT